MANGLAGTLVTSRTKKPAVGCDVAPLSCVSQHQNVASGSQGIPGAASTRDSCISTLNPPSLLSVVK